MQASMSEAAMCVLEDYKGYSRSVLQMLADQIPAKLLLSEDHVRMESLTIQCCICTYPRKLPIAPRKET